MYKPSLKLTQISEKKYIPLYVTFEVTHSCNLRCIHCYIPLEERQRKNDLKKLELNEIKNILKQLSQAGTMFVVFTGGELFLREDWFEILKSARELLLDTTIFTSGVLINESVVTKLKTIGISAVEITLYGKQHTHNKITKTPNSFKKTLNAIDLLRRENIHVTIKSPLMNVNIGDYNFLINFAESKKIDFKFDPVVTCGNDGNKKPLKLRANLDDLKKVYCNPKVFNPEKITNYKEESFCSAGYNYCSIDCYGEVFPCLQWLYPAGNLKKKSFKEIWNGKIMKIVRSYRFKDLKECQKCDLVNYCMRCPGITLQEEGDIFSPNKTACQIASIIKEVS